MRNINNKVGIPYIVIPKFFSIDECTEINKLFDSYVPTIADVGEYNSDNVLEYKPDHTLRKGIVTYTDPDSTNEWIHSKLQQLILSTNYNNWHCKITGFDEQMRRMSYGPTDHFNSWHPDYGMGETGFRKLTSIVLLDDVSNFTGGSFQIACWGDIPLNQGDCVIFPTYIYHRVTPILTGFRRSLVYRATGPHFA